MHVLSMIVFLCVMAVSTQVIAGENVEISTQVRNHTDLLFLRRYALMRFIAPKGGPIQRTTFLQSKQNAERQKESEK